MMGVPKLHPRRPKVQPANDAGGLKLLLSVIEGSTRPVRELKPPMPSDGLNGRASSAIPASVGKAPSSSLLEARRNLVTPTQEPRTPPLLPLARPPNLPLARPPNLPSAAMMRSKTQHKTVQQGLLKMPMPPSLRKVPAGDGNKTFALNTVNYNHMSKTITVVKKSPPKKKPMTLALAHARRPHLRSATPASPSQLHSVCCWANDHSDLATIIVDILTRDPMAIRRKRQVARSASCMKKTNSILGPFRHQRQRNEPYQFPINLALHHQSQESPNMNVLEVLAATGPDVLRMEDGRNGEVSLTVALRQHPKNLAIVQLLLRTNPSCIKVSDRRGNTPLHVACFQGAPLEVIEDIYQHDPAAIDRTNISGETPWQIIQRNSLLASTPVAEFLYACAKRREGRMRK